MNHIGVDSIVDISPRTVSRVRRVGRKRGIGHGEVSSSGLPTFVIQCTDVC